MKRLKNQNAHKRFWICFILKKNTARIGSGTGIKVLCAQYGLSDEIERALGLDPDDDGLLDGEEFGPNKNIPFDHDEDLIIDALTIGNNISATLNNLKEKSDDKLKKSSDKNSNDQFIYYIAFAVIILVIFKLKKK